MNPEQKQFYLATVEIRILAALIARAASRSIEERFNSEHNNMTGLQYGILRTLAHESHTLSDLSRKFVLDPSTLVPVIETMVKRGLVTRSRDPHDRRRMPISISDKGQALLNSVPLFQEDDLLFQCLDEMGEDKARELLALLREVIEHMPDGKAMLNGVTSRLYALDSASTSEARSHCPDHQSPRADEQHHRMLRRIRGARIRRRRSRP